MTAPQQFPNGWGAQPPAQATMPAPGGYAPPQQYAPQPQAQMPYAPPAAPQQAPGWGQPMPPAQGYPAPPQQYGPPPGYAAPQQYQDPYAQQAPPQPAFVPEVGTLDEYLNQPAAGAQFWKFNPGVVKMGMVERELRDSDVRQATYKGQPRRRADGSINPEKSLSIPLVEQDGSKWIYEIVGRDRTECMDAIKAAGVASGLPEAGSFLRVTCTGLDTSGQGAPRKMKTFEYVRPGQISAAPQQAAPAQVPVAAPPVAPPPAQAPPSTPAPQQYQAPQQAAPQPPAPVWDGQQWVFPQGQPQAAPAQQGPPPPQQYQAPGMDPNAQAMFGSLLGGAQPAPQ